MGRQRLQAGCAVVAIACGGGVACHAQVGVVRVTHDDPDGLIEPGQVVRVSVEVTWTPSTSFFAGLRGSVLPTPGVGSSSNLTSIFPAGGLVNYGSPAGGGWTGLDFATPPTFGGWCYPWPGPGHNGLIGPLLSYDWSAPMEAVGAVSIGWVPSVSAPYLRLYLSNVSVAFVEAQTTFVPAVVTVIPGPGAGVALLLGLGMLGGSRRRPRLTLA